MKRIPIVLIGSFAGYVLGIGGPDELEAKIAPIATEIDQTIIYDDGSKVCWTIRFRKNRLATPRFFTWQLIANNGRGPLFYLSQYKMGRSSDGVELDETSPKGFVGALTRCAIKPSGAGSDYVLQAHARYNVWHPLWTVPRYIAPFGPGQP